MKKLLLFFCLIISFSSVNMLAQKFDDKTDKRKQKKEKESDCDRIKLSVDQFTGSKTYSMPANNMKPFNSIWMPLIRVYKVIKTTGEEIYFMSFSIPSDSYIEGKEYNNDCIVLFENGKRIEKTTEVTVTGYTGYYSGTTYYYHTNLLLDSIDLELLRNNKMKAIRLINFDMDKIVVPEFYMYYINCLIEKK